MHLCIFNPEHDLCLASGRALYIPPRSAREFALRDSHLMQELYPGTHCCSAYDLPSFKGQGAEFKTVTPWGWNSTLKYQLLKAGVPTGLLPTDDELATIRRLQHRTTVLPLQPDCCAIYSVVEAGSLLHEQPHWVFKAPWSGAGRGLRWIHGSLSEIDCNWIAKIVAAQCCVIAEPCRDVVADLALEYYATQAGCLRFVGYSYFRTGHGVYKENLMLTDADILACLERTGHTLSLQHLEEHVECWLTEKILPHYRGPLGVDLMACADGSVHVAELNLRHTMGMVAHKQINPSTCHF